jgi:hypothetical protein
MGTELSRPSDRMLTAAPVSRREVSIGFDLSTIPPELHQRVAQTMTNQQTRKQYEIIQLQLDVCISQGRADIGLVCGKTTDMKGHTGVSGFPLGNCEPIPLA